MTNETNQSTARPHSDSARLERFGCRPHSHLSGSKRSAISFLSGRSFLTMFVLSATLCSGIALAQEQEFGLSDANHGVSSSSNQWWSLENAEAQGAPHRQLIANRTASEAFGSLLSAELKPVSPRPKDNPGAADYSSANLWSALESYPEIPEPASMLNRSSEPMRFFPYSLEADYLLWQSRLVDSRTLTSERGVLVYPLTQVDLVNGRVPIILYVPRMRGSAPDTAW